jgi:hypothetical protein
VIKEKNGKAPTKKWLGITCEQQAATIRIPNIVKHTATQYEHEKK